MFLDLSLYLAFLDRLEFTDLMDFLDLTEDFDWLTEKHFSMIGHKMWEMIHLTKMPSKTSKVKEFEDYLLQEIEKMQARWTNINFLNQPFDSPLTEAIQKMFKVFTPCVCKYEFDFKIRISSQNLHRNFKIILPV